MSLRCTYVCMCVCMYVCMYVRMYVCTYVRMYVHVCMYVCMYVCIYTYMYTVGGKSLVTFAFVKTNTKFCSVPFRFSLSLRSALLQFYCVNCERIPRTY